MRTGACSEKIEWEDKGPLVHLIPHLFLPTARRAKESCLAQSNQEPIRDQPGASAAPAALSISLSNHATCAWHLVTLHRRKMIRVTRCAIIIVVGGRTKEMGGLTAMDQGVTPRNAAKHYSARYPPREDVHFLRIVWDVPSPRCHTSMRLPRGLLWESYSRAAIASLVSEQGQHFRMGRQAAFELGLFKVLYWYVARSIHRMRVTASQDYRANAGVALSLGSGVWSLESKSGVLFPRCRVWR